LLGATRRRAPQPATFRPRQRHERDVNAWQPEDTSMADEGTAYGTLAGALEDLARRGFTAAFQAAEGGLRVVGSDQTLGPDDVVIREYHRFEGISDPDDMAIVYAIETGGGARGTLADAFGVYADPGVSAALRDVPIRPGPAPPP
jgi:hypothetical protein